VKGFVIACILVAAAAAAAVEVRLRDGTVIEAETYTLTGSYLMLTLPDGSQVAYDVADVDLEALRAAELAAAPAPATAQERPSPSLSVGRTLALPPEGGPSGLAITDQDVAHVRAGSQGTTGAAAGGAEEGPPGPPAGFQEGGGVVLNGGLQLSSLGEGRWRVEGEVVNRGRHPARDVRVQLLVIAGAGAEPAATELKVASVLAVDQSGSFFHTVTVPATDDGAAPEIRARVWWLQEQPAVPQPPASRAPAMMPGLTPTPMV